MNIRNFLSMGLCLLTLLPACGGESNDVAPTPPPTVGGNEEDPKTDTALPAYYVSSSLGSDTNSGTSPDTPWKTLERIGRVTLRPGDRILLRCGDTWDTYASKQALSLSCAGTAEQPIVISSFGTGSAPRLTSSAPEGYSILKLADVDHLRIENIDVGNGKGYGIWVNSSSGEHGNLVLKNIHTHDLPICGIYINGQKHTNIELISCTSKYTRNLVAVDGGDIGGATDVDLTDCTAEYCSYGGYSLIGIKGGTMKNCKSFYGCTTDHPEGACGIFLGNIDGYEVVGCEVAYQKRLNDNPDAEAIDFERNCHNVTVRDCYFHDNDGCAMMFFNNGATNSHCVIEGCRIENNHCNAYNPRGFEIHFTELGANAEGAIHNNTFAMRDGVEFVCATDSSVSIEGNKLADGTALAVCPAWNGAPTVRNGNFESPVLEYGKFEYRPIGGAWTFFGNAGVTGNGGAFNPPVAPEGSQALFLQGASSAMQRIALEPGQYYLTCKGACRSGSERKQGVEIYVDGTKVGDTAYPDDATAYADFESVPFTIEKAGNSLLEIRAITNQDVTAFIDKVELVRIR